MNGIKLSDLSIINHPKGDIFHALKKVIMALISLGKHIFLQLNIKKLKDGKNIT